MVAAAPTWRRFVNVKVLLLLYLILVVGLAVWRRTWITPDIFLGFAALAALSLGRGPAFARDWLPFIAILLAWEAAHSVANQAGFSVHSDEIIAIERTIAFGYVPTVVLQQAFHTPDEINALDIATTAVYMAHFILPLAVAFWFWLADRRLFARYAITLLGMSVAQFAFALLYPVAPPRFAGHFGEALPVADIPDEVTLAYGLGVVSWAYQHMVGNPVAAFPSLHAAYPILAALFLFERNRAAAALMLVYAAVVWFAIVYLGHHYLVDALGGAALAIISYLIARRISPPNVPARLTGIEP